jgi:hypothetical protein
MTPNRPDLSEGRVGGYERAFSTLGCPDLGLTEACAIARAHGIAAIELRTLGASLDLTLYFSSRGDSSASISGAAAGARIVAFGTSLRLADGTDEEPADQAVGLPERVTGTFTLHF